jgi:hypothetical protein
MLGPWGLGIHEVLHGAIVLLGVLLPALPQCLQDRTIGGHVQVDLPPPVNRKRVSPWHWKPNTPVPESETSCSPSRRSRKRQYTQWYRSHTAARLATVRFGSGSGGLGPNLNLNLRSGSAPARTLNPGYVSIKGNSDFRRNLIQFFADIFRLFRVL